MTEEQLVSAESVAQKTPGKSILQILFEAVIDEMGLQQAAAQVSGLDFERIESDSVSFKPIEQLGHSFCSANGVLPLRTSGSRLVLGVVHPDQLMTID